MNYRSTILIGAVLLSLAIPVTADAAGSFRAPTPVKITIPAIQVAAAIESVGLTRSKVMRSPSSGSRVAWFNRGAIPGQPGSAVMYGHVTGQHFEPTVFANLRKLKRNDVVNVTDRRGTLLTYRVRRLATFRADSLTYDHLSPASRFSHLNLYTCAGTWDKRHNRYTHYQVIYTDLVSVKSAG